jgi:hypothetical protein
LNNFSSDGPNTLLYSFEQRNLTAALLDQPQQLFLGPENARVAQNNKQPPFSFDLIATALI